MNNDNPTPNANEISREAFDIEAAADRLLNSIDLVPTAVARDYAFKIACKDLRSAITAATAEKDARISEVEDHVDLMADEFVRIKNLTDSDEIRGLCDRAIEVTRQHIPVITQRDAAQLSARLLMRHAERMADAMKEFNDKVESKQTKSVYTYNKFKELLKAYHADFPKKGDVNHE